MQLFVAATAIPGQLGKVLSSRQGVSINEWKPQLDDRDAIPFRLDERGLHVVSGNKYLVLAPDQPPQRLNDVLPKPAIDVVTTPSRDHAAARGPDGAIGTIDARSGLVQVTMSSAANTVMLGRVSGVTMSLDRQYPVWHAYTYDHRVLCSGKEATESWIPGALPAAPSPDGNRAATIDDDGEVTLWETSSGRSQASLGRFEHATSVSFPTEDRVVAFGPRALAFIDLNSKLPIARYTFPKL
jgi:hypothetical protein